MMTMTLVLPLCSGLREQCPIVLRNLTAAAATSGESGAAGDRDHRYNGEKDRAESVPRNRTHTPLQSRDASVPNGTLPKNRAG